MPRLLFVCVENADRSQMAEGFARFHGGYQVEAFSAGQQPAGEVSLTIRWCGRDDLRQSVRLRSGQYHRVAQP